MPKDGATMCLTKNLGPGIKPAGAVEVARGHIIDAAMPGMPTCFIKETLLDNGCIEGSNSNEADKPYDSHLRTDRGQLGMDNPANQQQC